MSTYTKSIAAAAAGLFLAGSASAQEVLVTSNITTATTWTANNTYNLQDQIYVEPGASLTIEAGTVIASDTGLGGSLAVQNGAQIFVNGTPSEPVIFTSKADVATWDVDATHPTGGDPCTGTWREEAVEWGNLTIMGDAYISTDDPTGSPAPDASNQEPMEGLVDDGTGRILYGGGNDDDDSGVINYVSLRYGGRVIGLNNELNGLSMGGIGRGTDIEGVEIMNNVDDGIEIWGGTANLKNIIMWNVGDDSFDLDQGWRGKAQFGLIVQGYSTNTGSTNQGSGVSDNCFEVDGAELASHQPVLTSTVYNFTVISQPTSGDHMLALRDNARLQVRQSIFMDNSGGLTDEENDAGGYGSGGTLTYADTWNTAFNVFSTVNAPANPAAFYMAQVDGNLLEISDSVIFNVTDVAEATTVGVFDAANNNVVATNSPIVSITRDAPIVVGGQVIDFVSKLDPRAANDAVTSVGTAPNDGFFTPVDYRGAFGPNSNWACGWTAADAFGFLVVPSSATLRSDPLGNNLDTYAVTSGPDIGEDFTATVDVGATGNLVAALVGYASPLTLPFSGRTILVNVADAGGELLGGPQAVGVGGIASFSIPVPKDVTLCGFAFSTQSVNILGGNPYTLSNAQDLVVGNGN